MLYELAHLIKAKCTLVWNVIEMVNSFVFSIRYWKKLRCLDKVLCVDIPNPYEMRMASKEDVKDLLEFFNRQPTEAFTFFNPHGFDEASILKVVRSKSFLTFVLIEKHKSENRVVGYAFMRSFVNGTSYRGYMVDVAYRGHGLAKVMGRGLNRVGDTLHLDMYKSISPKNQASMKATQAVCHTEILKTLDNGDYLIRCLSKSDKNMIKNKLIGGGKNEVILSVQQAFVPQKNYTYAA